MPKGGNMKQYHVANLRTKINDDIIDNLVFTVTKKILPNFVKSLANLFDNLLLVMSFVHRMVSAKLHHITDDERVIRVIEAKDVTDRSIVKKLINKAKDLFVRGEFAATSIALDTLKQTIKKALYSRLEVLKSFIGNDPVGQKVVKEYEAALKSKYPKLIWFIENCDNMVQGLKNKQEFERNKKYYQKGQEIVIDRRPRYLKRHIDTAYTEVSNLLKNLKVLVLYAKNGYIGDSLVALGSLLSGGFVSLKSFFMGVYLELKQALLLYAQTRMQYLQNIKKAQTQEQREYVKASFEQASKMYSTKAKSVLSEAIKSIITLEEVKRTVKAAISAVMSIPDLPSKAYGLVLKLLHKIFSFLSNRMSKVKEMANTLQDTGKEANKHALALYRP